MDVSQALVGIASEEGLNLNLSCAAHLASIKDKIVRGAYTAIIYCHVIYLCQCIGITAATGDDRDSATADGIFPSKLPNAEKPSSFVTCATHFAPKRSSGFPL